MAYGMNVECRINSNKLYDICHKFKKFKKYDPVLVITEHSDTIPTEFYFNKLKRKDADFMAGLIIGFGYNPRYFWVSERTYQIEKI
jgi:hypothetical protein